jgi:hypothetical protein
MTPATTSKPTPVSCLDDLVPSVGAGGGRGRRGRGGRRRRRGGRRRGRGLWRGRSLGLGRRLGLWGSLGLGRGFGLGGLLGRGWGRGGLGLGFGRGRGVGRGFALRLEVADITGLERGRRLGGGKEGDARGDRAEHVAASQRCPRIVRFRTLRSVAPDDGGGSRGADAGARGGGATREERVGGGDDGHSDSTSWPVKLWPNAASNADVICLGFQLNKRGKVKPLFYCYCLLIHFEINEAHDESPTARSLDLR